MDIKRIHTKSAGYSVGELCVTLCIVGCILAITLPNFTQFLMRDERAFVLDQLKTAIEYARQEAYQKNKIITLCASANGRTCLLSEDWSAGFIMFENGSDDRAPARHTVLQVFPAIQYGRLHFAPFSGKSLSIHPNGTTVNVGTFVYCPKNRDRREAEGLTINKTVRAYRLLERNALGIRIKNAGRSDAAPIICR